MFYCSFSSLDLKIKAAIMMLMLLQAIELMIVDALVEANDYLQISSFIEDPSEYWKVMKAVFDKKLG